MESWSVFIVNMVFYKYERNEVMARTIARHCPSVDKFRFSASISDPDQYTVGLTVLSGCDCKRIHQACTL